MPLIEFTSYDTRLPNEWKSKLLLPDSDMYLKLKKLRQYLLDVYQGLISPQRMDFHIELISADEYKALQDQETDLTLLDACMKDLLVKRASSLHWLFLDDKWFESPLQLTTLGKALVVAFTDPVLKRQLHMTVAHFPDGVPSYGDLVPVKPERSNEHSTGNN